MIKKIEDTYKILDQISHVLLRPQTYVGSDRPHKSIKWIIENDKMIEREVIYIPSFIKIFDEVIINSIDESKKNLKLNKIEVNIDKLNNKISIKETNKLKGKWMSMAKIVDNYYQFEAWSRYIIDHLFVLHKNNKKLLE